MASGIGIGTRHWRLGTRGSGLGNQRSPRLRAPRLRTSVRIPDPESRVNGVFPSSSPRRGLSQSLPPRHAHEDARAERRGRAGRSTSSTASPAGWLRIGRPRAARYAALRRRRTARSSGRPVRPHAGVVELQRHLLRDEEADNDALTALAQAFRVPVIATNGVRFAAPADRPLFDVLTCVHHHTTLDAAGRRLARNAERYLKSPEVMAQLFADRPDALAGTAALAERLEYTMADLGYRFPGYPVPAGTDRDVVPAPHHRGGRARSLSSVSRQGARADRARAAISSRSSISPATS